jgi:hypothetical protein
MAQARAGELVVIVNSGAAEISKEQVVDVYLGRSSGLMPIDQGANSPIYVELYKKATGRDIDQVKAIWSKIIFTGRGLPPKQMVDSVLVRLATTEEKATPLASIPAWYG